MNGDNWQHRSENMRCTTCMWFVEKIKPLAEIRKADVCKPGDVCEEPKPRPKFGRCRRHAPTMSGFPAVFGTDWCGDHKLDENKV